MSKSGSSTSSNVKASSKFLLVDAVSCEREITEGRKEGRKEERKGGKKEHEDVLAHTYIVRITDKVCMHFAIPHLTSNNSALSHSSPFKPGILGSKPLRT